MAVPYIETFRFEDEDDYKYEIWLEVFSGLLKISLPGKLHFTIFTRKVSIVIFSEGDYALSRKQNDKTCNT